MANPTQSNRPLEVLTPLGKDALLLVGFSGQEGVSQLFHFQLDLLADNDRDIPFDKLLGQKVVVRMALLGGKSRYFSGICSRFCQGERDPLFTAYQMEVVPQLWLLTRRSQSRIFQHATVPDILRAVLQGLDVEYAPLQGPFYPRNYCVQYRESDFAFASRLMEEEGIYYFFKHTDQGHKLVVGNMPQSHPAVPEQSKVIFETVRGGLREEFRVWEWKKVQELCSGAYSLWDHCFEMPGKNLKAEKALPDSVPVGKVAHKLKLPVSDPLEVYDYPGAYAQRFDGVDKDGKDRADDLKRIFEDNQRTVEIRMQARAAQSLTTRGAGDCRQFASGHKFLLEGHFNADGPYLLTTVRHAAKLTGDHQAFRSGADLAFRYENQFTCVPMGLPFRPPPGTAKPVIQGAQTATVVGPPGPEEIFCDKYGRVKVQFHWDRQGQHDADSSCWVRVASSWAGKRWGAIQLPRIGQEVVVEFLEGDPDRPIIVGNVYNGEQMPAFPLPTGRNVSGFKSKTNQGGGYNEFTLNDTKDDELIRVHSQKDMDTTIENDKRENVRNDRSRNVANNESVSVGGLSNEVVKLNKFQVVGQANQRFVGGALYEFVGGARTNHVLQYRSELVKGWKREEVRQNKTSVVHGELKEEVKKDHKMLVRGNRTEEVKGDTRLTTKNLEVRTTDHHILLRRGAASLVLTDENILLGCGKSTIILWKSGLIELNGANIVLQTTENVTADATGQILLTATKKLSAKGSEYELNTSQGTGSVKAATIVEVKAQQVQINC